MKKKFGLFVIISLIPVVVLSCALLGSLDDPLAFTKDKRAITYFNYYYRLNN